MMQQTQGGGKQVMQFGRSRAKLQTDSHQKVTLPMWPAARSHEELQIVDFLRYPKKHEMGARILGVLLFGFRHRQDLSGQGGGRGAGVPFLSIRPDFVEMFVGVGLRE